MKKIAIVLILLISVSGAVTAVMTFATTSVASPAVIKIVSSHDALVALNPGDYPELVKIQNGMLHLNFAFSSNTEQEFTFDELFEVTNNSADRIEFTVINEGISYISVKSYASGSYFIENGDNKENYYFLAPGESTTVEISFFVPTGAQKGDMEGSLRIKAQAVD